MSPLAATIQGRTAVAVSVAVHGVVIGFLSLETWFEPVGGTPLVATVVFIAPPDERGETESSVVPEPPPILEPPPPESPTEPLPQSTAEQPRSPEQTPNPAQQKKAEPETSTDKQSPAEPGSRQTATGPDEDQATAPENAEPTVVREPVDFDALGRAAVQAYIEREAAIRTFGPEPGEDLRDTDGSGGAGPDIFDTNTPRRAGLQPNRAKSRLARRLGRLCQELTGGGISLFGIMPLCTDNYGRRDLFASIRKPYLDQMPECREVEIPGLAAVPARDGSDPIPPNGIEPVAGSRADGPADSPDTAAGLLASTTADTATAIKCRMVPREEAYRD